MKIGVVIPYYENSEGAKERFKNLLKTINEINDNLYTRLILDLKIVIIDDGGHADWLDEYVDDKFNRFIYDSEDTGEVYIIHISKNMGVSYARNCGIDYLISQKVDYIGFIDSDDSISNDYFNELWMQMNKEYDYIDSRFIQDGIEVFGTEKDYERQKNCVRQGVTGCFYKTSIIGKHRFDENLQIGEDSKFANEVVDLKKHTKGISKGMYVYNKGVNENSLIMRYIRKEIGERRDEV